MLRIPSMTLLDNGVGPRLWASHDGRVWVRLAPLPPVAIPTEIDIALAPDEARQFARALEYLAGEAERMASEFVTFKVGTEPKSA